MGRGIWLELLPPCDRDPEGLIAGRRLFPEDTPFTLVFRRRDPPWPGRGAEGSGRPDADQLAAVSAGAVGAGRAPAAAFRSVFLSGFGPKVALTRISRVPSGLVTRPRA